MTHSRKPIVFISHISEESAIAVALKHQLLQIFSDGIDVFCSSDKQSIQGGDDWFGRINEALSTAKVVVALLSDTSRSRPWILYEIGVARGSGAKVIPLTVRNLNAGKLNYPIAGFQVWSIYDLSSIVHSIARATLVNHEMPILGKYQEIILHAEQSVTYKHVILEPVIVRPANPNGEHLLMLHLQNMGNVDIDLIHLELYVPELIMHATGVRAHFVNQVVWDHTVLAGHVYKRIRYWTHPGTGVEPLIPTITPSMGEIRPAYPRVILSKNIDSFARTLPLFYQLHARNYQTHRETTTVAQLREVEEFSWDDKFPIPE
jgi:hypothetical protein